jgi:hypothetical protein
MANKKQIIFILAYVLIASVSFAEEPTFDPFPQNRNSIYEYDNEHIPEICFFPVDKAQWDGLKIAAREWPLLTDFQKTMFISEYMAIYHANIQFNGWDYLVILNNYVTQAKDDISDVPITQVIEMILKENKSA